MSFMTAAMYFYSFWHRTRDPLFAAFALSFALLAFERIMLLYINAEDELRTYVYFVRLVAFILIILAIVRKNRRGS